MSDVFSVENFVTVSHRTDLDAVWVKYTSLYDEAGTNIPNAVRAAADYATANGLKNWVADTALPSDDLSPKDAEWVASQDFRDILLNSTIEKFVLIPAPPETGADISWIPQWQANTQAGFGTKITVAVLESETEVTAFLVENG